MWVRAVKANEAEIQEGDMAKMRVVQVPRAKGAFEIVEREIPDAGAGEVRIKVQACGVCHSDSVTKEGLFPGIQYPRVPGHEVVGVIDAVGAGVAAMDGRPAGGRRLARRQLRILRRVPARRFFRLRDGDAASPASPPTAAMPNT